MSEGRKLAMIEVETSTRLQCYLHAYTHFRVASVGNLYEEITRTYLIYVFHCAMHASRLTQRAVSRDKARGNNFKTRWFCAGINFSFIHSDRQTE